MLKLIALALMILVMVDSFLNSSPISALCIFAVVSFFYLVANFLMEELAVEE
jgi:hypothetical protein